MKVDDPDFTLSVDGSLAIAKVTPAADSTTPKPTVRYSALKMGDVAVRVLGGNGAKDFALDGTITVDQLDINKTAQKDPNCASACERYQRLDWDYTGTGQYLNPGAYLPTPTDLTIDFTSDMHYRVAGGVTGADQNFDPDAGLTVEIGRASCRERV